MLIEPAIRYSNLALIQTEIGPAASNTALVFRLSLISLLQSTAELIAREGQVHKKCFTHTNLDGQ